jgi:RNA polymerase sigma-70 factor (ECF subfamily)
LEVNVNSSIQPDRTAEFVRLFSSCSRRLYRSIRIALPHPDQADEVYQETSSTLWEKFGEFQPGTNFAAWAVSIARYKVLQFHNRKVRDRRVFGEPLLGEIMARSDELADSLERQRSFLAECVEKLSSRDRDLLHRRFGQGLSSNQVAEALRRSPSFVSKALSRIHTALFNCIRRREAEEGAFQ